MILPSRQRDPPLFHPNRDLPAHQKESYPSSEGVPLEGVPPASVRDGVPSPAAPSARPTRTRSVPDRLSYDRLGGFSAEMTTYMVNCCSAISALPELNAQVAAYRDFLRLNSDTGEMDPSVEACAYAASKSDPDTMRYHEAMMSPDSDGFHEAMRIEIALERISTWNIVHRDSSKNVLPEARGHSNANGIPTAACAN